MKKQWQNAKHTIYQYRVRFINQHKITKSR